MAGESWTHTEARSYGKTGTATSEHFTPESDKPDESIYHPRLDVAKHQEYNYHEQMSMTQPYFNGALYHDQNGGVDVASPKVCDGIVPTTRAPENSKPLETLCGPLLNYQRMSGEHTEQPVWHGSVLIVTTPGQLESRLRLRMLDLTTHHPNGRADDYETTIVAQKLYQDPKAAFWRFRLAIPFQARESVWEYSIPELTTTKQDYAPSDGRTFSVPSKSQSMRIMFHSCNGFSAGTDTEAWSGCALWNDVLRVHKERPFHVMIGGGDQIYNDGVRIEGPLRAWTDIGNPKRRRDYPFTEDLRAKCDQYYFDNYVRWYALEPFSSANGQIPQLNIWDDHDIIDGFGSYTDHFMKCSVFRGIGGVAHKYYLLFQHHLPPPQSTFTTDAPYTMHANLNGTSGPDAQQLKDSWVLRENEADPSYIIGSMPGPYVEERSRSIYCQLGARIAFVGIDARTERTRHQINYPRTYDLIFDRVNQELAKANGNLTHLILLLGVPIAYPRLQWLENIFQSPIIGPIRFLNKRFGVAGSFFNSFDGAVDLMDDLDDHYTAHQHKQERKDLLLRVQALAKLRSIRVTILGGDVHLAALGRFYSRPKLNIAPEHDWRYISNVISSAITNKPPPQAVANLLARRNKIHHLDRDTDETLLNLFDEDPAKGVQGVHAKSGDSNHCTMPSRNYAIIAESHDEYDGSARATRDSENLTNAHGRTSDSELLSHTNGHGANDTKIKGSPMSNGTTHEESTFPPPSNPRHPLHAGEAHCGVSHLAASGVRASGLAGRNGLDVTIRVEIDPSDRHGKTRGYGLSIPGLDLR